MLVELPPADITLGGALVGGATVLRSTCLELVPRCFDPAIPLLATRRWLAVVALRELMAWPVEAARWWSRSAKARCLEARDGSVTPPPAVSKNVESE